MEQSATRSHKCHRSKYFQEQTGQDEHGGRVVAFMI